MTLQRKLPAILAILGAALTALAASPRAHAAEKIDIVAYSTPAAAYAKIIPLFQKTPAGKDVTFTQSYGASGDQSRAVLAGQPATLVHLALEPDITRLTPKIVPANWNSNKRNGVAVTSVVAFVVRKGNPKKIKGWNDLLKPGVTVVTADPISSGGARWNALAAYGAALRATNRNSDRAFTYLKQFYRNAPTRPASARDALTLFERGYGDALVTYESEAIFAQQQGAKVDYVVPPSNILIETPIALTSTAGSAARAFRKFLWSDAAQREFAKVGFRSINPKLIDKKRYPEPKGLFTIRDFGGWDNATKQFFTPRTGLIARAQEG